MLYLLKPVGWKKKSKKYRRGCSLFASGVL
jgi:hypothetical protein